jgi:hypothetical protein
MGKPMTMPDFNKKYNQDDKKLKLSGCPQIGDSSFVIYQTIGKQTGLTLSVIGLNTNQQYYIDVFSAKKQATPSEKLEPITPHSYQFTTLAKKPSLQAKQIAFKNVGAKSMTVVWTKGNGSKRLVLIRKDAEPEKPVDGVAYPASTKFGVYPIDDNSNTYAIFNGNDSLGNSVNVSNLEGGKYYFEVFEYNGNGDGANYLTTTVSNSNPRSKSTLIQAPKALKADKITSDGFTAKWSRVEGAVKYQIDVSYDKDFKNIVDSYNDADVGDLNSMEIVELQPNVTYYYRVKAVSSDAVSDYSNTVTVALKKQK